MLTIGIHDGHNASVCLMQDGRILFVIQEERPTKEKNCHTFPFESIRLVLEKAKLKPIEIDQIGMCGFAIARPRDRKGILKQYESYLQVGSELSIKKKLQKIPFIYNLYIKKNQKMRYDNLAKAGFVDKRKIVFVEHHLTHAASAYFGNRNFSEEILVLTNDGAGDGLCATVSIGRNGKLERLTEINENHSIGSLYAYFTFLTGMVPLEHEYKIMGMAPYASRSGSEIIAEEFRTMFQISKDGLTWKFTKGDSINNAAKYLHNFMFLKRFDYLMGGLQLFTEEFLVNWVRACVRKTGIRKIALAGGTFMNVKANKKIMELPEVESVFIFPSCGDESNPIGICWYLQQEKFMDNFELDNVYWGIEYKEEEIEKAFENYRFINRYKFTKCADIELITAKLLSEGNVVGRFRGKEEFGARSLGNRALLANPKNPDVIKEINEMIKSRDFWMPFACSILEEYFSTYVIEYNKNNPYYMIMTFDTKEEAEKIKAGIHPYDKTVRPQLVTAKHNTKYHYLLKKFSELTGIGGLLNTSLNLHGLPLVHAPEDAFYLLEKSNLKYLAIENFLLEKITD